MNTASLALDNLERYGAYVSTHFEGRSYTNAENHDYACRLAAVLRERGVRTGDVVVVMMLNSPAVTAAFTAVWKLGAVIVPVTPMWNAREVRYVLANSGARMVITSPELAARLLEASADMPDFRAVLTIGETDAPGAIDIAAEINRAAPFAPMLDRAADDLAMLLYTSGTTGQPKGVMLSHDNLIFIADAVYANNQHLRHVVGMQVLPLSHVYGVLMMSVGLRMGTSSTILKHFDAGKVLAAIQQRRVQRLAFVPTMLTMLINHPDVADRDKYDFSSLEHVNSGGAPLSEAVRQEFARLFDCKVVQGYGLSETAGALTGYHPDDDYRLGSVGPALPDIERLSDSLLGKYGQNLQ